MEATPLPAEEQTDGLGELLVKIDGDDVDADFFEWEAELASDAGGSLGIPELMGFVEAVEMGMGIDQHGENECYLNIIDACIIKAWHEVKKHFLLISCIEAENSAMHSKDVEKSWRKCTYNLGFPQEPIDKCYNSGEGIKVISYHICNTIILVYQLRIPDIGCKLICNSHSDMIMKHHLMIMYCE
ncbi:hypothetical protein EZV62_015978 [Acer yangbiense]|uniref:Uncharacterized protein n=1 Tax=Acer yangbiense TaxID=1000413 RepID=A0A5C7HMV1_9ROSI|nr:hypothetical protein EZV62_015978 [Acer yangbiense]